MVVSFEVAGTVSDFEEADIDAWRTSIASAAKVDPSRVLITVTSGSVLIVAKILAPPSPVDGSTPTVTVNTIVENLTPFVDDAAAASSLLRVSVVSTPSLTWSAPASAPPIAPAPFVEDDPADALRNADDLTTLVATIVGSAVGALILCGVCAGIWCCRRHRTRSFGTAKGGGWEAGPRRSSVVQWQVDEAKVKERLERAQRVRVEREAAAAAQPSVQPLGTGFYPIVHYAPHAEEGRSPGRTNVRPVLIRYGSSDRDGRPSLVRRHSSGTRMVPIDIPPMLSQRPSSSEYVIGHSANYILHSLDV